MNIKTFIGNSSQEVLQKVKREMGPDAVILRTRTITQEGGTLGDRRNQIEVTAVVDYDALEEKAKGVGLERGKSFEEKWELLETQLRRITHLLMAMEASVGYSEDVGSLGIPRSHYIYYRQFGIMPENIHLIKQHSSSRSKDSDSRVSGKELQKCLLDILGSIQIAKQPKVFNNQHVYAFVGPTGVGKTTTIAKLAAAYKVKKKLKVALITLDTYRIGAVAQLDTYARIMGLPLEVANDLIDLKKALALHESADVILIDTAGRSPRSQEDISVIARALATSIPIHHYLVLSANAELGTLLAAEEAFRKMPIKSYIFTKLDEAVDGFPMVNFLLKRNRPVSYFTTGQNVPEDIELATRKRVAELILQNRDMKSLKVNHEVLRYGSGQSA